jgi:hypothetical protein
MSNKIAICVSGEPRYWNLLANSIKPFILECERGDIKVDIFYHLWDHVTKRQSGLLNDHILETIDETEIKKAFNPTVGLFESKDALNSHIDIAWNYIEQIGSEYTFDRNIDKFSQYVKFTNNPPFSQLISMCESLSLMANYSKDNNIEYDIVIRTRTDIVIQQIPHKKIKAIINKKKLQRYIQFPSVSVRGNNLPVTSPIVSNNLNLLSPYVEYCFFVTSGKILNAKLFDNYTEKISKLLFNIKQKPAEYRLVYRSSHNCVPLFLKQEKYVELGAPISGFNFHLKQLNLYKSNEN